MDEPVLERMQARARAVRTRARIRRWQYQQRDLAAGVWFRLRRVLADARAAYAISAEDASRLVAEGYQPAACGAQVTPEKTILFVDEPRLYALQSRRAIPLTLGPDFLTETAVALVAFESRRP
jgi:hypothetical protein